MRLTERDTQVVLSVYAYRALRREQIEKLFFPSQNTANTRLQRLYQHGFLERRWSPVEYGQGTGQAIYLLAEKGADLVAQQLGIDRGAVVWKESYNQVGSPFLEHTLMVNDVRIAVTQAASQAGRKQVVAITRFLFGNGEVQAWHNYISCIQAEADTGKPPYGPWKSLPAGQATPQVP